MAHGGDTNRPLDGSRIALIGRFASLTHEELRGLVQDLGGRVDGFPMRHTTYLVVGEGQLPLDEDARPPRAIEKARQLQLLGYAIEILSEHEFWSRFGLIGSEEPVRRLYTIGQLARILGVKRDVIRHWMRAGLICPVEIVHRLAFFDFVQVQSAKTLCDLTKRGVSTSRIRASLEQLRRWLPDLGHRLRNSLCLRIAADCSCVTVTADSWSRPGRCSLTSPPTETTHRTHLVEIPTADELFDDALELHDSGHHAEAAKAYLRAIELDPQIPCSISISPMSITSKAIWMIPRQLTWRQRNMTPAYVEAWNALGCVLSELGGSKEAIVALRRAVELVPDYGDAHYNLASELESQGQTSRGQ